MVSFDSQPLLKATAKPPYDFFGRGSSRKDSGMRGASPGLKLGPGLPLSAKHMSQTPIKILVSQADPNHSRGKRVTTNRDANVSHENNTSEFIIKKPAQAVVSLSLGKKFSDTKSSSFDKEKVKVSSSNTRIEVLQPRKNSSRTESGKENSKRPYLPPELMGPLGKNGFQSRAKVKIGSGLLGLSELDKSIKTSLTKIKTTGQNQSTSLSISPTGKVQHEQISTQPVPTPAPVAPQKLAAVVTQVNEEDMNNLGKMFGAVGKAEEEEAQHPHGSLLSKFR